MTETITVPKDTMMDILTCMQVMVELLNRNKTPTEDELVKLKYVNKTFHQAIQLFKETQKQ